MNSGLQKSVRHHAPFAQRYYDLWMNAYVMPVLYKTTFHRHKEMMKEMLSGFQNIHALDIACGNDLCEKVLDRTNTCTGLKISSERLKEAGTLLNAENIPFDPVRGDFMHFPFRDETFRHVICSLGLHFVPDIREAIGEAGRVMRPRAVFVCC
ncbi:MAG: methyltransferase domain-containing protein [Methanofollis sp.]|uniref:class I SAM-dependent methyltransferase n=1 Tax=Methanofollis sp. TaxID=2052835 RepID=UPI00345A8C2C|nr:methyltransferase domain-containing protein [Methanofollis sp.]